MFHRIVSGEARRAAPLRSALRVPELFYRAAVTARNIYYDRRGPRHFAPVPVVSVGNITAGGTGKTPLVIDLVRRLEAMGYSPAVVARGYGAAADRPGDEERLLRAACPSVAYLADADRARGAARAHARFGADVIVLDDAFQHRRLARTLDIVLLDATCPFGFDHLLPRGLLREPPAALKRADVVVITRCDQASEHTLTRLDKRVAALAKHAVHLKCNHRVIAVEHLDGSVFGQPLNGKRAVLLAGVANPRAFFTTVRSLGVDVAAACCKADHHRYTARDLQTILGHKDLPRYDVVVTTEKDAVKLADLPSAQHPPILVVKVGIDFVADHGTILSRLLQEAVARGANGNRPPHRGDGPLHGKALQTR